MNAARAISIIDPIIWRVRQPLSLEGAFRKFPQRTNGTWPLSFPSSFVRQSHFVCVPCEGIVFACCFSWPFPLWTLPMCAIVENKGNCELWSTCILRPMLRNFVSEMTMGELFVWCMKRTRSKRCWNVWSFWSNASVRVEKLTYVNKNYETIRCTVKALSALIYT